MPIQCPSLVYACDRRKSVDTSRIVGKIGNTGISLIISKKFVKICIFNGQTIEGQS